MRKRRAAREQQEGSAAAPDGPPASPWPAQLQQPTAPGRTVVAARSRVGMPAWGPLALVGILLAVCGAIALFQAVMPAVDKSDIGVNDLASVCEDGKGLPDVPAYERGADDQRVTFAFEPWPGGEEEWTTRTADLTTGAAQERSDARLVACVSPVIELSKQARCDYYLHGTFEDGRYRKADMTYYTTIPYHVTITEIHSGEVLAQPMVTAYMTCPEEIRLELEGRRYDGVEAPPPPAEELMLHVVGYHLGR